MNFSKIHTDQKKTITFHHGITRRSEFHRLKANIVSFQSVKFLSSGDTMVKNYGPDLVGMHFEKFRKNLGLIFWMPFWDALTCVTEIILHLNLLTS